jgi:hypothetical protein
VVSVTDPYGRILGFLDRYIQQTREIVLKPIQNVVGICKQITILILYEVTSRLVASLEFIYSSIQVTFSFLLFAATQLMLL